MARIGTFFEEVVCPAEQIVKDRHGLPFTHARLSDAPPQPGRAP
jgi:hypothetical protein